MEIQAPSELVALSRLIGDPAQDMAILGEGNTSCRAVEGQFWVKASGASLRTIEASGFVLMEAGPLIHALGTEHTDDQVKLLLHRAQVDKMDPRRPSVESFFHAALLNLPGVHWVGHAHPTALLSILCLPNARHISGKRLFPDEVVCCGPAAAFVDYVDPGLPLASAILESVRHHQENWGELPKTIWMANHGVIALGHTVREVESAMKMTVKAARAWLGALQTHQTPHTLTRGQVERIMGRPDEKHRQAVLWSPSTS